MTEELHTHFEVVIRFLVEDTAASVAARITKEQGYICHVREVAT